jgi:hypothetical protein
MQRQINGTARGEPRSPRPAEVVQILRMAEGCAAIARGAPRAAVAAWRSAAPMPLPSTTRERISGIAQGALPLDLQTLRPPPSPEPISAAIAHGVPRAVAAVTPIVAGSPLVPTIRGRIHYSAPPLPRCSPAPEDVRAGIARHVRTAVAAVVTPIVAVNPSA